MNIITFIIKIIKIKKNNKHINKNKTDYLIN